MRLLLPTNHKNPGGHYTVLRQRQRQAQAANHPFDYPANKVGPTIAEATIYYDPSLGAAGLQLAKQMLYMAPEIKSHCEYFFNHHVHPYNLIIAPLSGDNNGLGGAYHYGCDFKFGGTIYVDAAFGNFLLERGLVIAELTECLMGSPFNEWSCGSSNGEALSRFLAEAESGGPNGALRDFTAAPSWDDAGRPNFIDTTEATDQNNISTGCGMVYLYWMLSQGKTRAAITQAGGATLAANYATLTGEAAISAWPNFIAACEKFPPGGIKSDDPWSGG